LSTKEEKIKNFDPAGVGIQGSLFGLPFTPEVAEVVVIPVPWEVTVSYSAGTGKGPQAILDASPQLDFFVADIPEAWKLGVAMLPVSHEWRNTSDVNREKAAQYIEWLEKGSPETLRDQFSLTPKEINQVSAKLNSWVKEQADGILKAGKLPVVLGGDHSSPLGLVQALGEKYDDFGILQIDAHADLRVAYEGFEHSHASIMYNALKVKQVSKLVQVGIRDYSQDEAAMVSGSKGRIEAFYDQEIKEKLYEGIYWKTICDEIVSCLPHNVYISFDIDALDPKLCPNTGTPVAGGLEFDQAMYLVKVLVQSGRKIIGFDLCEVAPGDDEWDGNVGARVLYRLANLMGVSQGKLRFK
jgi:agmatinase